MQESLYKPTGIRDIVDAQGRPFHAYHGSNSYIFISYAHRNADLVYPVIEDLFLKGYNVWYDEGIPNFSDLEAEIKRHIESCSRFVMFASKKSLSSPYVQIEITHAYEHRKQIICVELEPVKEMALNGDLKEKMKGCIFISPERLQKTIPIDCRDATSREPDSFEPEQTGGRLESLSSMEDYLFELEDGGITLKKCTVPDADKKDVMELPSSHEGYLVRKTEGTFYYYWPTLRSVKLPDSLIEIGNGTFCGCKSLTSITLPQGLEVIGSNAFGACTALTTVKLPPTVRKIGQSAFHSTLLASFLWPLGIEKIEMKTFQSCERLTRFAVPTGVRAIGDMAFLDCTALKEVIIPETVTDIGREAFFGCKDCTVVCVKNSAAHRYVKENPDQLSAKLVSSGEMQSLLEKQYPALPSAVKVSVGAMSPDTAQFLTVELEPDRKEYAYFSVADSDCGRISAMLQDIYDKGYSFVVGGKDLEKNAEMIRACSTFIPLLSKDSVSLPNFSKECALAFTVSSDFYPIALDDGVKLPNELSREFAGKFILHCSDRTESDFLNELMNHLTGRACRGAARTAAERMLQLQDTAFEYTTTEEGVVITAYHGKESSVVIPPELYGRPVVTIGQKVFFECSWITSVTIPDGVGQIFGFCSFYGCTGLKEVFMPDSVTEIGVSAFSDCTALSAIKLSDHLKVIRNEAFSGCSTLSDITVPDSVTELGDHVFSRCTSLRRAYVSKNLKVLKSNTFDGCASLSEVELCQGLFDINAAAFRGCMELKRLHIPDSVIFIGMGAFDGCSLFLKVTGNTGVYREYLREYKEFKKRLKS